MHLQTLDVVIVVAYLIVSVLVGYWVSHRASKDLRSYFLGGNVMPWYVLGVSDASGMFDIAGTMWLVYIMFVYGLKSVWIPWVWPVFNQVFLMVYLSAWLRRSNAMTGAEWIETRFGKGRGAQLSHLIVVVFALVSVVGFLSYAFKGIGKFAVDFLPWSLSANQYALVLMAITTFYVVKGGMFSVVVTEVIQFGILSLSSVALGLIAMNTVTPEMLHRVVPAGWDNPFFGWKLDLDWTALIPSVNDKIAADGYSYFGIFFMMLLFKGILVSAAGPAPNYDMQRILSTKNPREASLMNAWVNVVLIFPRYFMITGLTILALVFYSDAIRGMGASIDFEMVLPYALDRFVPTGLQGLLIAGLLAAFMSNFAATVNAAPPYIVNDIYKRFINPSASQRTYVRMSYAASLAVVVVGVTVGFYVRVDQRGDPVDHGRALGGLHGVQRPQVVLVALQRLRLLLGDGDGHRRVAAPARGPAAPAHDALRAQRVPPDPRPLPRGLRRGHAPHLPGGRRGPEVVLQARAPVGILGADPRQGARGGPVLRAQQGLRPRHAQHPRGDLLADEPRPVPRVPRDPEARRGLHRPRRGRGDLARPEVHLVRPPRAAGIAGPD